ncbi:hypothetical protein LTR94_037547, partial [Friedmanniomyces endolithicus]
QRAIKPASSANGIWASIPMPRAPASTNGSASKGKAPISRPSNCRRRRSRRASGRCSTSMAR